MGYAQVSQKGHGLHLRQYARTFIVDDNVKRVVFVCFDGAMMAHALKRDVNLNQNKKSIQFVIKIIPTLYHQFNVGCEKTARTVRKAIHNG